MLVLLRVSKVNIRWIDSEELDDTSIDPKEVFDGVEGIIVPGGFGSRGVEGKIRTIQYARENNIPYLGLCLGMQSAVMGICSQRMWYGRCYI